jgi:hypothetical protein
LRVFLSVFITGDRFVSGWKILLLCLESSTILKNLIITTVPYHCSKSQKQIWLDRGSMRTHSSASWISRAGELRKAKSFAAFARPGRH